MTNSKFTLSKKTISIQSSKFGFTLIELLVVISIIGILIALSGVAFQATRQSARDAVRKTDLADIRSALEIYRNDCGEYPATLSFENPLVGVGASCSGNTYHSGIPQDPVSGYSYAYTTTDGTYTLCARLEAGSGSADGCGSCGDAACNYKVTSP